MISGTRYRLDQEINRQLALVARHRARPDRRSRTEQAHPGAVRRSGRRGAHLLDRPRPGERRGVEEQSQPRLRARRPRRHRAERRSAPRFDRATELMIQGATGTLSDQDRATIALELRSIADELGALKDSKDSRGNALFMSGYSLRIPVAERRPVDRRRHPRGRLRERRRPPAGRRISPRSSRPPPTRWSSPIPPPARPRSRPRSTRSPPRSPMSPPQRGEQGALANRVDQLLERQADTGLQLDGGAQRPGGYRRHRRRRPAQSQQLTLQAAQAVFARVNAEQHACFDISALIRRA